MEITDFVGSSGPVKRDQKIANNFEVDIIMECLTKEHSDYADSYTNGLLEYSLLCEQRSHKINEKVLEEVGQPESNSLLRAPQSLNLKARENDH